MRWVVAGCILSVVSTDRPKWDCHRLLVWSVALGFEPGKRQQDRRARTAASDPDEAERFLARLDPDILWQMVIDSSPASDLAVYQDSELERTCRRCLREPFAAGSAD